MFKPKHVKYLRRMGSILIALPEPITTPIGIFLIVIAQCLAKRNQANFDKRLFHLAKYYVNLRHKGEAALRPETRADTGNPFVLTVNYQLSGFKVTDAAPEIKALPPTKVIYHAIDMPTLLQRYEVHPRRRPDITAEHSSKNRRFQYLTALNSVISSRK